MATADTIAAVATPPGRGAIGVVRVSGPDVRRMLPGLLRRSSLSARRATLCAFLDDNGAAIDSGLAIFFPAPDSYTGEDVVELQGHGGPAVVARVLRRCLELGARLAEPGEFTRRAYLGGRMDLLQAEGVADLIAARSEAAARSAVRSLEGEFSARIEALAARILELRALVEACIDFPEEDVELLTGHQGLERLQSIRAELTAVRRAATSGRLLHEGARVVLCGRPNVGKSTLLNRLAGSDVAIVSNVPGTTRDTLKEQIQIDGVALELNDTAGLRDTEDVVERLGVERTRAALEAADLAVVVVEAMEQRAEKDQELLSSLPARLPRIIVQNKADLLATGASPSEGLLISAAEGWGIDELRQRILDMLGWAEVDGGVFAARERHLQALARVAAHLDESFAHAQGLELIAEHLRMAHEALGEIVGRVTSDDVLGEIFGRFCIGK